MLFNLQLTCFALLICAAVSVSYVNKVGNDVDGDGQLVIANEGTSHHAYDYENAGKFDTAGSRAVAGWTLSVSCVCLFLHSIAGYLHTRCREFDTEKHNTIYSITVSQCIAIMYVIIVHRDSIVGFFERETFHRFQKSITIHENFTLEIFC